MMGRIAVGLMGLFLLASCDKLEEEDVFYGYAEGRFRLIATETVGRIAEVMVTEGQSVTKGQILARLDDSIEQANLAEAKARLDTVAARYRDASLGGRAPEIQAARDQLSQAEASAKAAKDDLARVKPLVLQGALPQARLDAASATAMAADARVAEMRERLAIVALPAREHALDAIAEEQNAAEAALAAVHEALARRTIKAPMDGRIERLLRQPGELSSSTQPIFRFLAAGDMMAVVFVHEPTLATFKPGMILQAFCDSCAAGLTARISYIADKAEYTSPMIFSDAERARLVFRIEARLEGNAPPSGTPMTFRYAR